jgi:hypothetical protein
LLFIIDNKIDFPIPKIFDFSENQYEMEFLQNYKPLYLVYEKFSSDYQKEIINKIYNSLSKLHFYKNYRKDVAEIILNIKMETEDKLLERYSQIEKVVKKYNHITYVNGTEIYNFDTTLKILNRMIDKYIEKNKDKLELGLIHGDCQFNNILINDKRELKFIDPRGYFGNIEMYGIPEYDFAKVKFALSGYDDFDNKIIDSLIYKSEKEILIDIGHDKETITKILDYSFETLLMLTIWLGNPHSFITNEYKMITSYFFGLYLSKLFLELNHITFGIE